MDSGSSAYFPVCHCPNLLCLLPLLFLQMGQYGPCVHFSSTGLLFCGLGKTIAWGIAATLGGTSAFSTFTVGVCVGGIGQSALALNRFMEAGMVLGQGVSSLTWNNAELGITSVWGLC